MDVYSRRRRARSRVSLDGVARWVSGSSASTSAWQSSSAANEPFPGSKDHRDGEGERSFARHAQHEPAEQRRRPRMVEQAVRVPGTSVEAE